MARVGTCYFDSKTSAYRYYKPYGCTREDVNAKFDDGDIHVGYPPIKNGDKIGLDTKEGRYYIESSN